MPDEIRDEWPRFWAHFMATTLGCFLRIFLPVMKTWIDPNVPVSFPRWWVALLIAAAVSLVVGSINSNLPVKPRELVKSVGLGFGLDAALVLAKVSPV